MNLNKHNKNTLILEKLDRIGGHEYTININNKLYDIAFIFDKHGSDLHNFVKSMKISTIKHNIIYSSSDNDNIIKHQNISTGKYYDEIVRFYKLIKDIKLKSLKIFTSLNEFVIEHNFSTDFITYVLRPAISTLFIAGNKIGMDKPIYVMTRVLKEWLALNINIYNPMLWTIDGTDKIVNNIIKNNNLKIKLNHEVIKIRKYKNMYILYCKNGEIYKTYNVILSCDTITSYKLTKHLIKRNIYKSQYFLLNKYLNYVNKNFFNCYSLVHNYSNIVPKKINNLNDNKISNVNVYYHYTYFKDEKWILTGCLDKNLYLSISLNKDILYNTIPKSNIIYKEFFRHPGQNTNILGVIELGKIRYKNYNGLYFSGAGMYTVGHNSAYQFANKLSKIIIKNNKKNNTNIIIYLQIILIIIILYYLI